MIVILTENKSIKKSFKNLFGILTKKVEVERKLFHDINILNICINKKVKSKYIGKLLPQDVKAFLCCGQLNFIKDNPFKNYVPSETFCSNMCINAFFKLLDLSKNFPERLKIAILDLEGKYFWLLKKLIFYSKNIAVISKNLKIYTKEQDKMIKNYGATFFLSSAVDCLFNYNLVLSPRRIRIPISLRKDSVIFTSNESKVPVSGTVFYKYKFNEFLYLKKILPKGIPQELFLAVLYDIYKIKKISSFVPDYCFNGVNYLGIEKIFNF